MYLNPRVVALYDKYTHAPLPRRIRIAAAAAFYGEVPDALDVPHIKARLKAAGVQHAIHTYPGTDHAFHNDSAGARYNPEAAALSWQRTVAFLKDALR